MDSLQTLASELGWMAYFDSGEMSFGRRFDDTSHARAATRILQASLRGSQREFARDYALTGIEQLESPDE